MARTTEHDWLNARTVIDLGLYRATKGQFRKWRLFGVACTRRAMVHFRDPRLEPLVEAAEGLADGVLGWDAVKKARKGLTGLRKEMGEEFGPDEARISVLRALDAVTGKTPLGALGVDYPSAHAFRAATRLHLTGAEDRYGGPGSEYERAGEAAVAEQVRLAYEVFGNPLRPTAFDPIWRTPTVSAIAAGCYADRDFSRLPVLADALEDAGCDAADLLAHLRGPGPHVRGCWALDLVLDKS